MLRFLKRLFTCFFLWIQSIYCIISIRFIYGLRKYDHVSQFRAQLKLPIRLRRDMHILCFLFNILNYQNFPSYLCSRFKILPSPSRSRRSCVIPTLDIPKSNTKVMQKSFSVYAALLWEKLPKSIQESPSTVCPLKPLWKTFYERTRQYLSLKLVYIFIFIFFRFSNIVNFVIPLYVSFTHFHRLTGRNLF